jgi:hypothetical protein
MSSESVVKIRGRLEKGGLQNLNDQSAPGATDHDCARSHEKAHSSATAEFGIENIFDSSIPVRVEGRLFTIYTASVRVSFASRERIVRRHTRP